MNSKYRTHSYPRTQITVLGDAPLWNHMGRHAASRYHAIDDIIRISRLKQKKNVLCALRSQQLRCIAQHLFVSLALRSYRLCMPHLSDNKSLSPHTHCYPAPFMIMFFSVRFQLYGCTRWGHAHDRNRKTYVYVG